MSEFNGSTRRNTVFPKGEDALESSDLLRLIYRTGTEDPEALPDPHAFQGGLNGFDSEADLRAAAANRPKPRPPT